MYMFINMFMFLFMCMFMLRDMYIGIVPHNAWIPSKNYPKQNETK